LFAKYGSNWCRYCGEPAEPTEVIELFAEFFLHATCLQQWKAETQRHD
jgi:hypothetical protein